MRKIIGYTTGVFDMFHIGHLNLLKNAKSRCDYLIVGVSTDDVVQTYKHKKPIIPFEERIAIVDAIKFVDMVVPQDTMDKLVAFKKYHFDVMFHGDDWKNSDMYNVYAEEFEKYGIEIVYLPYTKGISSTKISEVLNFARKDKAQRG